MNAQYSVKVGEVGVRGSGSIGLKNGALIAQGKLEANATLLDAQASARAKWGMLDARATPTCSPARGPRRTAA